MILVKEEEGGREREKEESLVGDDEIKTWGGGFVGWKHTAFFIKIPFKGNMVKLWSNFAYLYYLV